jgi:hypothetical protein
MRIAKVTDKNLVVDLLVESFLNNPNVQTLVKNDKHKERRIKHLSCYIFDLHVHQNCIYLSSDEKGFAILTHSNAPKLPLWKIIWLQFRLVFSVIGWTRVWSVFRRDTRTKKRREKEAGGKPYIHFYALGISKASRGLQEEKESAILEFKHLAWELSEGKNIPLFAETTVRKNKIAYEWLGFKVYQQWEFPSEGFTMWLLMR